MTRARMFRPGDQVTMVELAAGIVAGEWFYLNHKPMHPGWLRSMQFNSLQQYAARGFVRRAIRNADQGQQIQTEG